MSMNRTLVTGGAGGIGLAVARHQIAAGRDVVVLDRLPPPADLAARFIAVDMMDEAETAAALAAALAEGPITRLVNNVGMVRPATLDETSSADFAAVMRLNLGTAIQATQALLASMRAARFGRIVNVSSRAAYGKELRTAYAASKAGLLGATRTWALELGKDGITVNAVAPGPIATPLFTAANPPDAPRTRAIVEGIPVGRVGLPQDVAEAIGFFLCDGAGFITGQTLAVCGGVTVGKATV
ncbi:MAG: short-chain dehydrogenase [Rhizobiales bacterium 24-66-13]|jgi:NAD(P)-dependent dehydrogenase (short-subunit alcohol dehydrogenase family)|nr:MAG: short-chain dehydrogenase [Azorhizobium sp. 12-66-6]OYY87348.1 MAG: short-chain dehydrogenase [Rhizobiales bacterium 35-66-30]OYZ77814.1 MAG: short-chain dehydrogenase [Rhizobiales bacterium 24-66-13]OZB10023.1 MAG: short-chain dehydrogenase [Rhizobiales bacterium 39-66-18]